MRVNVQLVEETWSQTHTTAPIPEANFGLASA